ncbi:MAG: efflux RND transporter periplasmic adaptor subunit [Gammaproteobacteria bacterium]|nr:efflux RND transporter periplasmic adaptor subunit [Gammaproteobacteria bacterium]
MRYHHLNGEEDRVMIETMKNTGIVTALLLGITLGAQVQAADDNYGDIITVESMNHQSRAVLGGTVVPARQVMIAAQMPGRVDFIAGTEGDSFTDKTALVALDDEELLAKRQAAIAAMANADSALRNAGVQYNRELINPQIDKPMGGMGMPGMFDQMFTRNFSDMMGYNNPGTDRRADLYSRRAGIEQARSAYTTAQSQLRQIDTKLRDAIGYAPFDGVITKKMVEVGDTVQPGTPLIQFADTNTLHIQIEIPARLMPGIKNGQILTAKLDVGNVEVDAKVVQIYPMADPIRHTVTVKLELPIDAPAAPGMYAEVGVVDVNSPARDVPVIPVSALVYRGSLPSVYVLNDQGNREMRAVRKGSQIDDDRIVILSGLHAGERVINNPRAGITSR